MSLRYNIKLTDQGSYIFTTDSNIDYIAFFTTCPIEDKEGNTHKAYSFGFERSGKYSLNKFTYKFDDKIKHTIIFIIKEFFRLNGSNALIYFCFQEDEYGRHRSIVFSKWHSEELSKDIEHYKKNINFEEERLYGGVLVLRENPLRGLVLEALDLYIDEIMKSK